ncbi:hypothetical protein BDV28DRAFT_164984 [Aspergillus coremiiformis]|uniref:Uncharacterized protein n=1 Tax=Aspergillus coremiiformis TaxID=138285 RepID=A0A5N6YU32_9EURO|nr:hypothetical protein BDV28DRAFT_164984 [Aspergillus coremiiformis]
MPTQEKQESTKRSKRQICQLQTDHIDQRDAENAGILQRSLSLESKPDNPYCFIPYEEELEMSHLAECDYAIYDHKMDELHLKDLAEPSHHRQVSFPYSASTVAMPLPHMKCMIESEVDGDDRLLRGELVAIINTMITRLHTKSRRPRTVAPTKLYDMRQKNMERTILLTRWWLGFAVGETKSIQGASLI